MIGLINDLSRPFTYLITDGEMHRSSSGDIVSSFRDLVLSAVDSGIDLIQIREKHLAAGMICELAKDAVSLAQGSKLKILVNERTDIAIAANADGVHLTSTSIPIADVRDIIGDHKMIAVSTHTKLEVGNAKNAGADLVVFGPVFETANKPDLLGISGLTDVCNAFPGFPIVAIGGIDGGNVAEVIASGAAGIAAIRALNDKKQREKLMRAIR